MSVRVNVASLAVTVKVVCFLPSMNSSVVALSVPKPDPARVSFWVLVAASKAAVRPVTVATGVAKVKVLSRPSAFLAGSCVLRKVSSLPVEAAVALVSETRHLI